MIIYEVSWDDGKVQDHRETSAEGVIFYLMLWDDYF